MSSPESTLPTNVPSAAEALATKTPDRLSRQIYARFEKLVHTHVLSVLDEAVREQRDFVDTVDGLIKEGYQSLAEAQGAEDKAAFFRAYTAYNRAVYDAIAHRYESNAGRSFDDIFAKFAEVRDKFLHDLPTIHSEIQQEERFANLADEEIRIRVLKFAKRQQRAAKQIPWATRNTFRKLAKKAPIPRPVSTYRIPLRNLTRYYCREEWAAELMPTIEKIYYHIATNTRQLWHFEDQVYTRLYTHLIENYGEQEDWLAQLPKLSQEDYETTVAELRASLDKLQEDVTVGVETALSALSERYTYSYDRVGTAELPTRRFSTRALARKRKQTKLKVLGSTQGWRNTLFALHEDWRIDQEVNLLCTTLFNEHARLKESLREKVEDSIVPQLDRVISCINEVEAAIHPATDSSADSGSSDPKVPTTQPLAAKNMKRVLEKQQEVVDAQLIRSIIPSTIAVLYRQALPAAVSGVYKNIQEAVGSVADKRALVSTNAYDEPIKNGEIDYISPQQIISFESLPKLLSAIEETKEGAGKEVLETQKMITEIGQVSYFNLDSALSLYEDAEQEPEKAQSIAEEGLQRACKSTEAVKERLHETIVTIDDAVWQAVKHFNTNLVALKSNDYALEIKLRIAKAKALERTQAIKQQSLDYLKHGIPYAARYSQQQYQRLLDTLATYRKRIGIAPAGATVTTEVSDFLNDTEVAVNRLPYVYQRLYGNRPLEDLVFYEERTAETEMLQKAYHSWSRGRYASTILVGEKGTGATTLINFFLKKIPPVEYDRYEMIRVDTSERVFTEAGLLQQLSTSVPGTSFQTLDQAADYFCQHTKKHIIVWEDVQHTFLRKVGGFAALKLLFELISQTHKQVFWLCACTQYAWDFLDKTARISDYFEYIVPLENIGSVSLREAILKRHRVSGYGIQYTGTVGERSRKKFLKMAEVQQQEYLEAMYFDDLTERSAGNYSIAQLYWLRSTQQVLNDTITIGSLHAMDFSFTKSIPLSQMLILHALLLHDGLSEPHFQAVSERRVGKEPVAAHLGLRQLRDDGLISLKDDIYRVNPLLYRQIVQLLRSKNFLH